MVQASFPNRSKRQLREAVSNLNGVRAQDPLSQIDLLCCVEEYCRHWAFLTRNHYLGVQEDTLRMRYRKASKFYQDVSKLCGRLYELKFVEEKEIDMLFVLVAVMRFQLDFHLGLEASLPEVLQMPSIEKCASVKLE